MTTTSEFFVFLFGAGVLVIWPFQIPGGAIRRVKTKIRSRIVQSPPPVISDLGEHGEGEGPGGMGGVGGEGGEGGKLI